MQSDKSSRKASTAQKRTTSRAAEPASKTEVATKPRGTRVTAPKKESVEKFSAQHSHASAAKTTKPLATAVPSEKRSVVQEREIAELAYSYWVERGHSHGSHEEDWLRAESVLASGN